MSNPYVKSVRDLDEIDVYIIGNLYEVKSHAVFHAIKKLICAGKRGAKDYEQDLMEAIESIERELQMMPSPAEEPTVDFDEQRIDAIGQNGNDGEHYEPALTLESLIKEAAPREISEAMFPTHWSEKVDWSLASPHHQWAYKKANGDYGFSMHEPMAGACVRRPTA